MAGFGLEHLVVAPISAEANNSITYGTGAVAEHARRAAITYNWDEGRLNGDNKLAEYRRRLNDADIELETTELPGEMAVTMGLEKVKTAATTGSGATPAVYTLKTNSNVSLGVGYVCWDVINNEDVYTAVLVHKVTLTRNNEERTTKEDTMNWQCPTVSGKAWPVDLDASGEDQIRDYAEFTGSGARAAAIAWIDGKLNVS